MNNSSLCTEAGYVSLNKYGEQLCGDRVEQASNEECSILVLADGHVSGTVDARDATKEQIGLMMTHHDAKEAQP